MLRSAWLQQELLTTFNGTLAEVALRPNHNKGGIFVCTLYTVEGNNKVSYTLWDRAEAEAFPEAKVLKQRVRDVIDPGKSLGHSDGEEAPSDAVFADFANSQHALRMNVPECLRMQSRRKADGDVVGIDFAGNAPQVAAAATCGTAVVAAP